MKYARRTKVTTDKSRAEIEKTLTRYDATGFMYGWTETGAVIGFMMKGKQYKCALRMPDEGDFATNAAGSRRPKAQIESAVKKSKLQRWRALSLVIKAKLEAVESEISTVESEFLPWMVLPNGQTVGEWMKPQLDVIYQSGKMPPLLPGGDEFVDGEVQ
jgi:hypothetical protein